MGRPREQPEPISTVTVADMDAAYPPVPPAAPAGDWQVWAPVDDYSNASLRGSYPTQAEAEQACRGLRRGYIVYTGPAVGD